MSFQNSLRLAYMWLVYFPILAHAGIGVVRFANEGEIVFEGDRVVKAAGVLGSGGVVVLEEGLWIVGDQTVMVNAGKETDLGKIKIRDKNSAAPPVQHLGSGALKVEAASDQQWRLAGESAWRQGSATVMVCDGSHRLEWREGGRVAGRLLIVSEGAQLMPRLPAPVKLQLHSTTDSVGTWITGPARDTGPQSGDVAILQDANGKVVAWQQLGSAASDTTSVRVEVTIPLVALDKTVEMVTSEDSLPKLPVSGSGTTFKGWETVSINNRDYVTAESIRNFYNPLYGFTTFRFQNNQFTLGSSKLVLEAQIESREMQINQIKLSLSFPVTENNGKVLFSRLDLCKLIDPVLCPSHIQNADYFDTVVIDAGHGGHDDGAHGVLGLEKDFSLQMAMAVRTALMQRGFKIVMTRATDVFVSDAQRVTVANQTDKSIFIGIRFNSSGNNSTTGIETLALTPQASTDSSGVAYNANGHIGNKNDAANISLATAIQANVISRFKFVDRGVKRSQLPVLTGCKRPSIVFKGGFVSNEKECLLIASDDYRQQVSAAIGDAVVNYRKALESALNRPAARIPFRLGE
jgi:N-acetylmuramoyl-L-alanine amidase